MRLPVRLLALATLLAGTATLIAAEDWPQWRGPRADGISKETLPDSLPKDGPKKLWSAKIGFGYACPIAVKGIIYAFASDGSGKESLFAINANDGKPLWNNSYASTGLNENGYKGTRATPAFEDNKIYTLGGGGQVTCWDAADAGKVLWQTNVLTANQAKNLGWGTASSPLLDGDRVYVQVGSGGPLAVGLNKKTGQIDWKTEARGLSGYAHPIIVDVEGTKQLVIFGGKAVTGVALDSGKTLWQNGRETSYDVNATTPIYRDGHLFVSSGYSHGGIMLKLTPTGAEKEWESKDLQSKFPGVILDGDFLYGNSAGKLKCLHWPDGKPVWTAADVKLNDGGSLVKAGDKILALSERGKLYLLKADGTGQAKLGEAALFDTDQVWATPLLYDGKMYAKGGEELVCYELNAK